MRFEIILAGIIASASAQVIEARQDDHTAPPSNLATTLTPASPVDAQVTDLAIPEAHEELLGPLGDIASAIAHSVETSVLGKVTDVPASELNKLSSSIAAKESDILGGAISAAAEASATKKEEEGGNQKEEKLPVETGMASNDNDREDHDDDHKNHDHDHDHDEDHKNHDHDHDHDEDHKDHDKDDEKDDNRDEGEQKQAGGGDSAAEDDAATTGEAAEDDASTAGEDVNAGDIVDEANDRVGADTEGEVADDKRKSEEDNLASPEGFRKTYFKYSENAAETLVAWTPIIGVLFGVVVLVL